MRGPAVAVLAVGCAWPLLPAHPLAEVWAVAVACGYGWSGYVWPVPGRPRFGWWLAVCGLLWAGSLTGIRWVVAPGVVCWVGLWVVLAAGAVVLGRDASPAALISGRPGQRGADQAQHGRGFPGRGVVWAATSSALVIALLSVLMVTLNAAGVTGEWAVQWWPGPARQGWAIAAQGFCAVTVPVMVGIAAWRRRSARAAVSALLAQLATPLTVEGMQATLRAALDDPTATVFYSLPDGPGFISATGEPVDVSVDEPGGRLVYDVAEHNGEIAAVLSVDGTRDIDPVRVEIALMACGPALENTRLQAVLSGHLRAVRQSRAHIVQAAVTERRRLARDLHDGAQQYLLALGTNLVRARQKATQPQAQAAIDVAREQLQVALRKLRRLGRDLYPPALETEGLTAALESLSEDGPLDVNVAGRTGRLDPAVEIVIYLTVREILEGLSAYCLATCVTVTVSVQAGRLLAEITSDGQLGDDPGIPSWLSVVIDRMQAVDGDVSIKSSPESAPGRGGICVRAWIPCG